MSVHDKCTREVGHLIVGLEPPCYYSKEPTFELRATIQYGR